MSFRPWKENNFTSDGEDKSSSAAYEESELCATNILQQSISW